MTRIVVTAQVEDSAKWEAGFRTHVDLFKRYTVNNAIHFTANNDNEVAIIFEVDDVGKFFEELESSATVEAMSSDGVKRETVKTYVLDKELEV